MAETDRRGLYKDHSYVSLFECCVHKLGFSEAAAYRRIRAARSLKLFPPIGPLLRQGRLTLESIALLHPFLKDPDAAALVSAAAGKRVWEVERLIASRRTEEPRRDVVRFIAPALAVPATVPETRPLFDLPAVVSAPNAPASIAAPTEPPAVSPSPSPDQASPPPDEAPPPIDMPAAAPVAVQAMAGPANHEREAPSSRHAVRIAFTADESFFRLMKEAQAAMRHKYPSGRLDEVFRDALEALLRKKTPWAYRKGR
ncbi:MAG: hypothetical protein HYX59_09635 [Elusimicrobia bacterium]|nr:hypothetical protein [Elusimicrobiota bacterium]